MLALLHHEPLKQRLTAAVEMAIVGMLAPLIFYGNSALRGSLVQDQMKMRFEPQLMGSMFFWGGLSRMISRVETWPLFILAVIGAVVARERAARALLAALFIGYFAFAVAFTYHMPTHDYYHLPFLPVIAIGVAVLFARLEAFVPRIAGTAAALALGAITLVVGTRTAWPRMEFPDAATYAQMYRDVGEVAEHDTHVLFLDPEYGFSMMYHAEVSGDSWPNVDDLAAEAIDGRAPINADARFERDYAWASPTYFIVTDLDSLAQECAPRTGTESTNSTSNRPAGGQTSRARLPGTRSAVPTAFPRGCVRGASSRYASPRPSPRSSRAGSPTP